MVTNRIGKVMMVVSLPLVIDVNFERHEPSDLTGNLSIELVLRQYRIA